MAIASEFVLNQVALEVQYDRGSLYFDKCGSLLLALEDALGKPFEASVAPTTLLGELQSPAERLSVQYGPNRLAATHGWVESPARLEQIAPVAWDLVAATLDVGKQVKRCGVRFLVLWKTDSKEEAQHRIARAVSRPPDLEPLLHGATTRGWSVVTEDAHGTLRIALDVMETRVQGTLQGEIAALVPPFSVFLDVDHTFPGTPPFSLSKAALKDFIRSSWQRTREVAKLIREKVGTEHA